MEKNLTTGSVGRQLIGFSLPYLLSYLLQTLYGMADLFIIGQYEGVAGTTAVAVGSQVMYMLTVMIVGLAMGTTVSIARAIGADDRPQAAPEQLGRPMETKQDRRYAGEGSSLLHKLLTDVTDKIAGNTPNTEK